MSLALTQLLDGLRAAAEVTRLRLLAIGCEGEFSVSELTRILGQSQPRVSRHLKLLCEAGLLERAREQNCVYYRVPGKGDGAELARRLLTLVPVDDALLRQDRKEIEAVKAERAQRIAAALALLDETPSELLEPAIVAAIEGSFIRTPVGDLVDIGTGCARMLTLLAPHADSALGIDIAPAMLTLARTRLHAAGLKQVAIRQGDMYRLPLADACADTVCLDQLVLAAKDPVAVLKEAARILRPRGRLLVVDYLAAEPLVSRGQHHSFIAWLQAAGFGELHSLRPEPSILVLTARSPSRQEDNQAAA